uniref:Uncharacterized protein n=1 Tax=Strongyloides papillosus TaxID=174720 RepID=A0A0N5B5Y0_STREA
MTSPWTSAPPYRDSLEGTNAFTAYSKGNQIRSSFNNLVNDLRQRQSNKITKLSATLDSNALVDLPDLREQMNIYPSSTKCVTMHFLT